MPKWSYQPPGEGWLDALSPFTWMQIRPLGTYDVPQTIQREPAVPDIDPRRTDPEFVPSLGETCFLRPDGEIVCVVTGSIWETERRSTGWPEVRADTGNERPTVDNEVARLPYEPIPTDVETSVFEPTEAEPTMAVDWGTIFSGAVDIWQGQQVGGAPTVYTPPTSFAGGMAPVNLPPPGGSDMDVCAPYGRRKRRRRRPLLTPTDLNTLAALKTITGNNDALKFAVMKAVRR